MEPEPIRQFVSEAARCKARAAFELCAPVNLTLATRPNPGRCFELSLACLVWTASDTAGRVIRNIGRPQDSPRPCHRYSFCIDCLTARFDLWLIVQEHA